MRSASLSILVAVVVLASACGGAGAPPSLRDLQVHTSPVKRGEQATGQITVADPDGLSGLELALHFSGPAMVDAQSPVQGASDAVTEAPVPFFFMLTRSAPPGVYTLSITATDGDGNISDPVEVSLDVQ